MAERSLPITLALSALSTIMNEKLIPHLAKEGLHMSHFNMLWIVIEVGPLKVGQLSAYQGCVKSNTTYLLTSMEKKGLLERVANPEDRRGKIVRATRKGLETFQKLKEIAQRSEDKLREVWGEESSELFVHLGMIGAKTLEEQDTVFD